MDGNTIRPVLTVARTAARSTHFPRYVLRYVKIEPYGSRSDDGHLRCGQPSLWSPAARTAAKNAARSALNDLRSAYFTVYTRNFALHCLPPH